MSIEGVPFQTIDWSRIPRTEHPGERGHVVHVLDGELVTELRDGRRVVLAPGQTYVVGNGDGAHRSSTQPGARLLIVD